MNYRIILVLKLMVCPSLQLKPWVDPNNDNSTWYLARAICAIARSRFLSDIFILNFIYTATEYPHLDKQQHILTNILQNVSEMTTKRVAGLHKVQLDESSDINIFLVATSESLMKITLLMQNGTVNAYGYNVFAFTENLDDHLELFENVSKRLFKLSTIKVLFLLNRQNDSKIVDIFSFLPFSMKECHSAQLVHLNFFNNDNFQSNDLRLSGELYNFHGCPLDALLLPYAPYMIQTESSKLEDMDGIDITILRILMEHLNFTLSYNTRANSYERGDIFLNGTATGVMKMIMDGDVHFVMGGVLWSKARNMHLSPSISYDSFELYLAVPMGRPYTGLEYLLMPFQYEVWIVLSLLFIFSLTAPTLCASGSARLTKFTGDKIEFASAFTMTSAWFESPLSKIPRQNILRVLLNLVLFGLLILRTAYKGSLYDHLQARKLKTPNTIQEYVNEGYNIITVPFFKQVLTHIGFPEKQQRAMTDYNIMENIFRLADDPSAHYIIIQARRTIDFFNSANWSRTVLRAYPERVFNAPISIFFTKHSYLQATFDREIMKMISCGITENVFKRFNNRSAVEKPKVFEKYTLHHLEACFQLFCFMLVASLTCFLCEVIVAKSQRQNCSRKDLPN